jgi:hypothetical protein
MKLRALACAAFLTLCSHAWSTVVWFDGQHAVSYTRQLKLSPVVEVALDMFNSDMMAVTGRKIENSGKGIIQIIELDQLSNKEFKKLSKQRLPYEQIIAKKETFYIGVHDRRIVVMGSDGRGTAYGILELSRLAGVSPWVWWGDVKPEHQNRLVMSDNFKTIQSPAVAWRGISLNNEDWSLRPWAHERMDTRLRKGDIGPRTYKKIFELLLRLRANMIWPASGEGTTAFARVKGNREVADSCDIVVGSSSRLPNDVAMSISDDNYGYLPRISEEPNGRRKGGIGACYHLSAQGQPHDYLWLSTTQPGLIYNEMRTAYDTGAKSMWIAEVHNPKVAAYGLSLFMDMAWNIEYVHANTVQEHLLAWLRQQFGKEVGDQLLPAMTEFYRLTGNRRPEFMGWSQVDLDKRTYDRGFSPVSNTEFDALAFGNELERYLADFQRIKKMVDNAEKNIRPELKDAFFAAIKYPVYGAAAMAVKHLEAQESRLLARPQSFHIDDEALESAARSINAYREIQQLTAHYNQKMAGGKWHNIMSMAPRALPVFSEPALPDRLNEEEIQKYGAPEKYQAKLKQGICIVRNACDYSAATTGVTPIEMLGHSMKAIALPKDGQMDFKFNIDKRGEAILRIATIPTNASNGGATRYAVSIDGENPQVISLNEPYRSDGWKQQVMRGQAVHSVRVYLDWGSHTLSIKALDPNIIVDQWMIDYEADRKFYLFPIQPALK